MERLVFERHHHRGDLAGDCPAALRPETPSLEASFDLIRERFPGRILPIDFGIAVQYGDIQAKVGPLPTLDTLIGATAIVNRLTVITRNTPDISRVGVRIHDPWI